MNAHRPPPPDALLQRYQEANALDPARPGPALREAVLAHAKAHTHPATPPMPALPPHAANDAVWRWRALGSLAMVGLVGLLVMQFEQGSEEERSVALGTAPAPREAPLAAASPAAVAQANESAAAPAAATAPQAHQAPSAVATPPAQALAPGAPAPAPKVSSSAEKAQTAIAPMRPALPAAVAEAPSAPATAPVAAAPPASMAASPVAQEALADAQASGNAAPSAAPERALARAKSETAPPPSAAPMAAPLPPLHAAVARGDLLAVQQALAQGAAVDGRDAQGRTALMRAVQGNGAEVIKALLKAGADPQAVDNEGLQAKDWAMRSGHAAWLPLLQAKP